MNRERILGALREAHAAGDAAAATRLASLLKPKDGTQWMDNYSAADEVGPGQAALIGAGRVVDKLSTGVSDLFASDEGQAATAATQRGNDAAYAQLQEQHPYATTAGEIGAYVPTMMMPGGMAAQVAAGGLTGAAMYNTPEERAKQGAIDAAITAAPYGVGKVLKRAVAAQGGTRLAKRADELGWGLTPAEQLNSPALRGLEASMESFPPTAGPIRKLKAPRQSKMNEIALKAIGETGDTFSDDALLAARARVGDVFESTIKPQTYKLDDTFLDALGNTESIAKQGLLGGGDTTKIIDNILEQAKDGAVSGEQLQQWRTTLQTAAYKAGRSDSATSEYANALDSMVEALDGVVGRTLGGDDLKAWQGARKQWRAIKQLEKSKAIDEAGNVRGRKLANNLTASDTQGYYRGENKSDLYDAARLSKEYPPMPDSGTASRLSIPMMMATPVGALAGSNLAAKAYANPQATARGLTGAMRAMTSSDPMANASASVDSGARDTYTEIERLMGLSDDPTEQQRRLARELRRSYTGR